MRVTHLNKGPIGMASMTACGRNIMRTPMSVNWNEFKHEPVQYRCINCAASKQFEVNAKMDARKEVAA